MATEKALRTRQSLLESARLIILNEGIDALTMDRVAQVAQVSKGACMYHFRTKRALMAALIEDYAAHLREGLLRHEAMFEGEPEETLIPGFVEWYREFDADNRGWAVIGVHLLSQVVQDPELMKPVQDWYREVFERVEKLPEEKRAPAALAVMALEGLFYTRKFGMDRLDLGLKMKTCNYITSMLIPSTARRKK